MSAVETELETSAAEPAPSYEFDAEFQQKIAALLVRDTPFAQLTDGLIKPDYFESSGLAALVSVTNRYFEKYKKAPGDKVILASLLKDAVREKTLPVELVRLAIGAVQKLFETDVSDRDYVADQCATFARHQAVTKAVLETSANDGDSRAGPSYRAVLNFTSGPPLPLSAIFRSGSDAKTAVQQINTWLNQKYGQSQKRPKKRK